LNVAFFNVKFDCACHRLLRIRHADHDPTIPLTYRTYLLRTSSK
jgi:hypothetical protein